jgi:hypothetical protein
VEQPPPIVRLPGPVLIGTVSITTSTTVSVAAAPAIVVQGPGANPIGTITTTIDGPRLFQADKASKHGLVTFNVNAGRADSLSEISALWVFPGHVLQSGF